MDTKLLQQFLIEAKKHGYASDVPPQKEADGSFSNHFVKDEWSFHDNWFGGEPFGGREVVFYKQKPYWMMVYYGSDSQTDEGTIPFLRKALSNMPEDLPARGPKLFEEGDNRYQNLWKGALEKFSGEEKIFFKGNKVYQAEYAGGFVDRIEG